MPVSCIKQNMCLAFENIATQTKSWLVDTICIWKAHNQLLNANEPSSLPLYVEHITVTREQENLGSD